MQISPPGDYAPPQGPRSKILLNPEFFIAFVTCVAILVPFAGILSIGGNFNRFLYGHDRFGNVCGVKNVPISGVNCSGKDFSTKPISRLKYFPTDFCFQKFEMTVVAEKCVNSCRPPDELIFHRCYPGDAVLLSRNSKNYKHVLELLHAISEYYQTIIVMVLTGLALTFAMLVFLRWYHAGVIFWTFAVLQILALVAGIALFCRKFLQSEETSLLFVITATGLIVYLVFILAFLVLFHRDLPFLISLYNEAMTALFSASGIFVHSLLSLGVVLVSTVVLTLLMILVLSNQSLHRAADPFALEYRTGGATQIFALYMVFMMLWIYGYAEGWQTIVAANRISEHYLQRTNHNFQIGRHQGPIACGSFMVTFFSAIRGLAEFLTRKAYIQTVLHEQSVCKSNFQIITLMRHNWYRVLGINGFHYILFFGFSALLMVLTASVGISMNSEKMLTRYFCLGVLVGGLIACVVAAYVFHILSVAVDTIFLCQVKNVDTDGGEPVKEVEGEKKDG